METERWIRRVGDGEIEVERRRWKDGDKATKRWRLRGGEMEMER
jgi:hypothetical protein